MPWLAVFGRLATLGMDAQFPPVVGPNIRMPSSLKLSHEVAAQWINTNSMDNTNKINISLEYNPTRDDVSHQLVKGRNCLSQTPFFAIGQFAGKTTDYFVHGNSRINVYEDGKDASTYGTWRSWRISHLSDGLNPDDGPPQNDWADDNVSKIPNWIDIPGYKFARARTNERAIATCLSSLCPSVLTGPQLMHCRSTVCCDD